MLPSPGLVRIYKTHPGKPVGIDGVVEPVELKKDSNLKGSMYLIFEKDIDSVDEDSRGNARKLLNSLGMTGMESAVLRSRADVASREVLKDRIEHEVGRNERAHARKKVRRQLNMCVYALQTYILHFIISTYNCCHCKVVCILVCFRC